VVSATGSSAKGVCKSLTNSATVFSTTSRFSLGSGDRRLNEAFDSELAEVAGMITRTMSAEMNAAPELAEIIEKISEFLAKAFFIGLDEALDEKFWAETGTYSVSGNTLTLTFDHDPITLTRK